MRAGKASEDSRGHRPVSGGATTDVGHASGVDGLIAARVGLADQLRASGRAGPSVSAVFGIVPGTPSCLRSKLRTLIRTPPS
jgi:hypothetical protein